MSVRTLIIVLLAATALAACGRRGNLELPSRPVTEQSSPAPSDGLSPLDPGSTTGSAVQEAAPAPKRRFLLDFLL